MSRAYVVFGTFICLLAAYANFSGWRVLAGQSSAWGPKGAAQGSTFHHK